jgi:heme/copper-type cytochrome/quinol oxidase subunit 3
MKNETFGMYLFLLAEVMFFAALASVYTVLRNSAPEWHIAPVTSAAYANLAVLIASGITMWLGGRAIRREDPIGLRIWLGITIVLGTAFLGAQVYEFFRLWPEIPLRTVYGGVFYVYSALHGVHVLGGLIFLGVILIRGFQGKYNRYAHLGVALAALYWYFVVIVWVFLFLALYIY